MSDTNTKKESLLQESMSIDRQSKTSLGVTWTRHEVDLLLQLTQRKQPNQIDWNSVSQYFEGKKVRDLKIKYNYSRQDIEKGKFTEREDLRIMIG